MIREWMHKCTTRVGHRCHVSCVHPIFGCISCTDRNECQFDLRRRVCIHDLCAVHPSEHRSLPVQRATSTGKGSSSSSRRMNMRGVCVAAHMGCSRPQHKAAGQQAETCQENDSHGARVVVAVMSGGVNEAPRGRRLEKRYKTPWGGHSTEKGNARGPPVCWCCSERQSDRGKDLTGVCNEKIERQ